MTTTNNNNKFIIMENSGRHKLSLYQLRKGDRITYTSPFEKTKWDGVYYSGSTSAVFDVKNRSCSITKYNSALIEKEKYNSIKTRAKEQGMSSWYIMTFSDDNILFFDLDKHTELQWREEVHNRTTAVNTGQQTKWVAYLPFSAGTVYNVYYDFE
jgi:hypothetical protein